MEGIRMNEDSIKWRDFQAREIKNGAVAVLAGARVAFEGIKSSRRARVACWIILAALALTLWTLVTFRIAQRDALNSFEDWKARFSEDFISQQEAKQRGLPPDPREELRAQQATVFAKLMDGLKLYGFSLDDFRTLAQGIQCRMNNAAYPDTFVEVVEQPGQWPGYSDNNEVTQKSYKTALQILSELDAQEHPPITSDFVFASFEKDGITLRNTWEISTKTHFWRYGE
jgi:hypothetical protein